MIPTQDGLDGGGRRGLTLASWNVRGLNSPIKRGKVFAHLKSLSPDIIFLQETHLKNDSHARLRCKWIGNIYHSSFPARARGTAIMMRKNIPFIHEATIADKEGRFLIVTGELYSTPLTLLNIYAPNIDSPSFFKKVMSSIPNMSQTNLIIGGDFNCILDPYLDRSSTRRVEKSKSSIFLDTFINNTNMADIWRITNPTGREYSFYSAPHNSYTRIDYFLIDAKLMPYATDAKYHSIVVSDHSPLTCNLAIQNMVRPQMNWRLNPLLLTEREFCDYLKSQISLYFETNDNADTSPAILWEAFKAFLRGSVISFEAYRRKKNKARLLEIDRQINKLDKENARIPSIDLHKRISSLKYEYNKILSAKVSKSFLYIKQKYFEFGDKPHRLLARQLRKQENDRTIHKIKSDKGEVMMKPKDINDRFLQFYKNLYTSNKNIDYAAMQNFLDKCNLSQLDEEESAQLDSEISVEEIQRAITSLKSNKAPGPDGLPGELYKKFNEILCPYLHRMFIQANNDGVLPPTLTEAVITVIYKKDKDPEEVGSYRPISLLNQDGKLFSKVLANRVNPLLNKLVHPDQTGFIPNRHSFHNLRRLFNIIYATDRPQEELAVLALDAEKAFDQVEWPYLFEILKKFKFGQKFISMVKLLYDNPCAQILTNQTLSSRFNLHRGTRQGCPLSPLIFALAIEPLAESIRSDPLIYGYVTEKSTNKISLYADDVLLYLTQPETTIVKILEKIKTFGTFAGYRINWNKSELMPIRIQDHSWLQNLPFRISLEKFTYLGIQVTKCHNLLLKANFPPLLSKLQSNIQFWRTLPISLLGRVNAIKMVFLPQLLYLFQNIPVFLAKSFFKQIDAIVNPFLWDYKTHRIGKKHLCKPKREGGLALPNFLSYYWASNIRIMTYWLDETATPPNWLQMEQEACQPYTIGAILLSPSKIEKSLYNNNVVIHSTLRIWKQIRSHFNLAPISYALPIVGNPTFPPSNLDDSFKLWKRAGIHTVGDLYIRDTFASLAQIQSKYKLRGSSLLGYLQIRDYVRRHLQNFETFGGSSLDGCLQLKSCSEKAISYIYDTLQSLSPVDSNRIKIKWEEEMGIEISDTLWEGGLEHIHQCSNNARHCLIQFKILHRLHYSKERLHKIYPEVSPTCDRCLSADGTLLHSFVECPRVRIYWINIFKSVSEILQTQLEPDPFIVILGVSDDTMKLTNAQQCFLSYSLITARRLLLMHWKKKETPSTKMWLSDLTNTLHLERIRYAHTDRLPYFEKVWSPLIQYLAPAI